MPDPYQPKFVDLVRNFTSTTGTGNIVLGAAVTGFRSLGGAVAAGDQFYYCIMGNDRPAEREVGRGTLMANGTVARQPIGGAATNFTSGTKTIALVVAAEWFDIQRQWINGGAGDLAGLATTNKTSLVAAVNEIAAGASGGSPALTFISAGGTAISGNLFDTVGYSAAGKGSARYVFSAAVNAAFVVANPRSSFLAAGGRGFRLDRERSICPQMVGAIGDGVADDLTPLQAWLDLGGALHLPPGEYYSSQRLQVRRHVAVRGTGFGFDGRLVGYAQMPGSRLRFAAGVGGIIAWGQTTMDSTAAVLSSGGAAFTQEGAAYSSIEGIGLIGGGGSSGTGFENRATSVTVRNVRAIGFGGKGFDIQGSADAADVGSDFGSPSLSALENCYATGCGSHGFHIRGRDASVVNVVNCDAIQNSGWGFVDDTIFGCNHHNCHAATNTLGSYKATSVVSANVYTNCYVEGGTGQTCSLPSNCKVEGGLLAGTTNSHPQPAPTEQGLTWFGVGRYLLQPGGLISGFGRTLLGTTPVALGFGHSDTGCDISGGALDIRVEYNVTHKDYQWKNSYGVQWRQPHRLSVHARHNGPGFDAGIYVGAPNGLPYGVFLGATDTFGNAGDGSYNVGDTLLWPNGVAAGHAARVCVSAGTKASTAWAAGQIHYGVSVAAFAATYRTNAGNVYKLASLTTPGAAAASPPVHATGTVVGADGFGWQYCNASSLPLFAPAMAVGSSIISSDGFFKRSDNNAVIYSPVGGATTFFAVGTGSYAWQRSDNAGSVLTLDNDGNLVPAGNISLASGKAISVAGLPVLGARGAAVANATDAASVITQLNLLLARCRVHGLIA